MKTGLGVKAGLLQNRPALAKPEGHGQLCCDIDGIGGKAQGNGVGWLLVNVLAPVLLPPLLLCLAKTTPAGHRLKLMEPLKDGQLCWFAITLSAATFYDLLQNDESPNRVWWSGGMLAFVAFTALLSGVYAIVAAIEPTRLLAPESGEDMGVWSWMLYYKVFWTLVALSVVAAGLSLGVQEFLPRAFALCGKFRPRQRWQDFSTRPIGSPPCPC